jgi:hypothetical protein
VIPNIIAGPVLVFWILTSQVSSISNISVNSTGGIEIAYSNGKVIRPTPEKDQETCIDPAVAADRQTAGWLVAFRDSARTTSYPVPTTLIIYRAGKVVRKVSNGFVIGRWQFSNGGREVAFYTDTLHGGLSPYHELRDIETNRIIAKWEGALSEKSPDWVKRLF